MKKWRKKIAGDNWPVDGVWGHGATNARQEGQDGPLSHIWDNYQHMDKVVASIVTSNERNENHEKLQKKYLSSNPCHFREELF